MATTATYLSVDEAPTREEMDRTTGLVLLEFGTEWCGFCRALAPKVREHLAQHPEIRHVMIEDGPGQKLGRSYRVKLWPNLVFLRDGAIVRQLARPSHAELREAFAEIIASPRS